MRSSACGRKNINLAGHEKPVVPEVASDAYSAVIGWTEQAGTSSKLLFFSYYYLFISVAAQLLIHMSFPVFQYYNIPPVQHFNGGVHMEGAIILNKLGYRRCINSTCYALCHLLTFSFCIIIKHRIKYSYSLRQPLNT